MALLIYSGILLITRVQIKAFNEARDEVLSTWSPSWDPRGAGGRRAARPVYSYSPVMKYLYAEAWSTGGKNRLEMMSSSKSFLALSFWRMPAHPSIPPRHSFAKMQRIYFAGPMQVLWPYCFFTMVIVLNQFINLQEPSSMLTSKIKSRSFHQFTEEHRDGKWKREKKNPPLPPTRQRIKEAAGTWTGSENKLPTYL